MNWVMHHHYVVEVTPYPFRRAFVVSVGFTDTQSGLTSLCCLPSPKAREKQCWYISMVAVTTADITPESPVKRTPSVPPRWASGVIHGVTVGAPVFRAFIPVPLFAFCLRGVNHHECEPQ